MGMEWDGIIRIGEFGEKICKCAEQGVVLTIDRIQGMKILRPESVCLRILEKASGGIWAAPGWRKSWSGSTSVWGVFSISPMMMAKWQTNSETWRIEVELQTKVYTRAESFSLFTPIQWVKLHTVFIFTAFSACCLYPGAYPLQLNGYTLIPWGCHYEVTPFCS